jgi:hypothetical protein
MKVLLSMPYFDTLKRTITPPLGMGYIASSLGKKGHNVAIKDFQIEYIPIDKAVKQIIDENYDAIGISAITDNRFNAIELIRQQAIKFYMIIYRYNFSIQSIKILFNKILNYVRKVFNRTFLQRT